jgi:hypothetical protein
MYEVILISETIKKIQISINGLNNNKLYKFFKDSITVSNF